ncbi:hypothetical protein TYRP_018170 [Tyrophagus putrescentiae]|nr:hypothetical protein TYRP_018170 [Tyrophagus putrescentiae]
MDQQQQQQSTVTAGDNSKAMWEYEAPQYCDFSSADTFVDTDPTVDKFFLTDHDSTKENDDSDADIFATPLTTRSAGHKKSLGTSSSCYRTPKSSSAAAFDCEATPVAPPVFLTGRLSTLRQTPLREIYNQGGKPLHEAGRRVSVFGKKSAKKAAAAAANKDNNHKDNHNNSRRETFDMGNVAEAIEEIGSASVAASAAAKEEEEEEKSSDKENHNGPPVAADELMSEEEEEEEGEAVKKSEETVVEAFHSVDAEKELSEEAAAASAAPSMADDSSALNSSRRSSYIVKSPSIRVVHFADESVRNSRRRTGGARRGLK